MTEVESNVGSRHILDLGAFVGELSVEDDASSDDVSLEGLEQELQDCKTDDVVAMILSKGTTLRDYTRDVENNLRQIELESIEDYIKESDNLVSLHDQIQDCDIILSQMEKLLSGFQVEIGSISSDIKILQEKSMDMGLKLKNRKAAESILAKFVEDIIVPPRMIDIIVDGEVNEEFMRTLDSLNKKIKFVEINTMVKTSQALSDVQPELEKLRQKAVSKVFDFIVQKLNALREVTKGRSGKGRLHHQSSREKFFLFGPLLYSLPLPSPNQSMGIEIESKIRDENIRAIVNGAPQPIILGLQPSALVDHVARVDWSVLSRIPGEAGGSFPVDPDELKFIIKEVNAHIVASPENTSSMKTIAGGSVANTIRGLAAGFGVSCGIIGAYGDDEEGKLFRNNMNSYHVDLSRLRLKFGHTAQCVCVVDEMGNRTMRPCFSSAVKLQANDLTNPDLRGSKWVVMRYGIFNLEIIEATIKIAKEEDVFVSLDLASFEMVRKFKSQLLQLLESGSIDLCFANEDEATELVSDEEYADSETALNFLAKHCRWAVVTLGAKGCMAMHGKEVVRVQAIGESNAVDATGAGDLFASGFLYGLVKGLSLEECCKIGSCSGGSVIRSLGGEVTPENWQWMYKQMQTQGLPIPRPFEKV